MVTHVQFSWTTTKTEVLLTPVRWYMLLQPQLLVLTLKRQHSRFLLQQRMELLVCVWCVMREPLQVQLLQFIMVSMKIMQSTLPMLLQQLLVLEVLSI